MPRRPGEQIEAARALLLSPTALRDRLAPRAGGAYRSALRAAARRRLASLPTGAKVHLGCGTNKWPGWVNVDIRRSVSPDVTLDLRGGFPAPPESVAVVYSEHVFEHLEFGDAMQVLGDVQRALTPNGVIRIAMPDLDEVVDRYRANWRDQAWLDDPDFDFIDSPARMMNVALRWWGHKYLYSYDELVHRLSGLGYRNITRREHGQSEWEPLRDRETRPDSLLIVEAQPGSAARGALAQQP